MFVAIPTRARPPQPRQPEPAPPPPSQQPAQPIQAQTQQQLQNGNVTETKMFLKSTYAVIFLTEKVFLKRQTLS